MKSRYRFFAYSFCILLIVCPIVAAQTTTERVSELIKSAESLMAIKMYDGVIRDTTEALNLDPTAGLAFRLRGGAYFQQKNWERCALDLSIAISRSVRDQFIFVERALCYAGLQNFELALKDLDSEIAIRPYNEVALSFRGQVNIELRKLDSAVSDFTKALSIRPTAQDYHGRGLAYLRRGAAYWASALADAKKAVELKPDDWRNLLLLGKVHNSRLDPILAIPELTKALALSPNNPEILYFRARAYAGLKRTSDQIADLTACIKADPRSANCYTDRASTYIVAGDYPKGIADLGILLEIQSQSPSGILHDRAWAYLANNEAEAAFKDAEKVLGMIHIANYHATNAVAIGYFALRKANKHAEATAFLTKWIGVMKTRDKYSNEFKYLNGEFSASTLLATTANAGDRVSYRAFIGMMELLTGNKATAKVHFTWVKSNTSKGAGGFPAAQLALAELSRLSP